MASPAQLFLLADHIKLSLLERQRAISLNLEPNSQDGQISQLLDLFREGLDGIETERLRLGDSGDAKAVADLGEQQRLLRQQFDNLTSQFRGFSSPITSATTAHPNNPSLSPTFEHAQTLPARASTNRSRLPSSSSLAKQPPNREASGSHVGTKSVRFSDRTTADEREDERDDVESRNRAALFPYRDDPDATTATPNQDGLDNTQIHAYHAQVLQDQDDQLDRLGESIGRQRELSMQIGDELDSQVQLLDDVDRHVDRHQTRLDTARRRLGKVARRAKDNVQLTIILVLIVILVLLIIITKG
ncbi:MAG: hypothetical protein M1815_002033 [Lichina confinis]|nr:MAG: hypothetical protein M1815_002033 [Lichina confinis]